MKKLKKKLNDNNKKIIEKDLRLVLSVTLGTIIYCFAITFILNAGMFCSGGITGIGQLVYYLVEKFTGTKYEYIQSLVIFGLNIPLFIIAWKGVSKRFVLVSLLSVVLQTALLALFGFIKNTYGFNPFSYFSNQNDVGSMLTLAILGGLITGVGSGLCLRFGGSSGGLDVLSQYLSLNKHISFARFSLIINLCIISVSAITLNLQTAVYTAIRLIIDIMVLDKIHTIYNYSKITIVTTCKDEIKSALLNKYIHGITVYDAHGGYTNEIRYVLESVVWSFEVQDYINIAKSIDPNCFISTIGVKRVDGKFKINVIA